jgi:uracil-DNA glycosylase family 4
MPTESPILSSFELLQFYVDCGADEAMLDAAVDRTKLAPTVSAFPAAQVATSSAATLPVNLPPATEIVPATPGAFEALGDARLLAAEAKSVEALKAALEGFNALTLKRTATQIVFADGNPASRIMIVGEKPGPDEDRLGRPFAGQQGQLLDKMLAAIGLSREENVYITNVINWRPPGDRALTEAELALSLPFIQRHIELVNPAVLIYVGGGVTKALMPGSAAFMRLRGKWAEHKTEGLEKPVPVMPVFHPDYLLKSPLEKRVAWADLLKLKEKLASLGLL